MFGSTPECGEAKLSINVHRGLFEDALLRMEKLANERKIQFVLPFLDECQFQATIICPFDEKWKWRPNVEILVLLPEPQGKFSLDQFVIGQLEKFPGSAVLSIQGVMHGRPNVKCGLHIWNVCKTNVHTLRAKKVPCKKIILCEASVEPHRCWRLAHPSKIAFSFGLVLRPWMTDKIIIRV